MTYQYTPIPGLNWIRLLKIIPRKDSQAQIQLVERALDDESQAYEAVSYTWGSTVLNSSLELSNGELLPITGSLASALSCLLSASSTGHLWIDQLFINQNDLEERNNQVAQMGKVYSGAQSVLIWLGHDTEGHTELIQEMVPAIGSCPDGPHPCEDDKLMDPIIQRLAPVIDLERPAGLMAPSRGDLRREAITGLLSRPWWKRAWVFQECVFAQSIKVFLGTSTLEWRDIEYVAKAIMSLEYNHSTGGYRNTICKRASGWDSFQAMMCQQWAMKERGSMNRFLGYMSQVGGKNQTTDPREFIFAFAGLTNEDGVSFTPDYSQSVVEVYADATRAFIDRTRSLDVLAFVMGTKHWRRLDLPSWSLDWSRGIAVPMPIHDAMDPSNFHASGLFKYEREPGPLSHSNALIVRGKIIDEIKFVRSSHAFERHYFMDDLHNFLDIEGCFHTLIQRNSSESSSLSRERILRATIADDGTSRGDRAGYGYLSDAHISELWATYVSYPQVKERYNETKDKRNVNPALWKLQQASLVTQSKRVFLSKQDKVGLTPRESHSGDKICILHGSKAPVVLRSNGDATWMPIGMCFLENAMFGEAITWDEADTDVFTLN